MKKLSFIIFIFFSIYSYAQFQYRTGKTDAQIDIAENYVNTEYINQKVKEACSNLKEKMGGKADYKSEAIADNDIVTTSNVNVKSVKTASESYFNPCSENSVDEVGSVFGPTGDALAQVAVKGYSMIMGLTALKGSNKAKENSVEDICNYIPMATEVSATVLQQVQGSQTINTPVSSGNEQSAAFFKMARLHKTRANTALFQSIAWGATGACYITAAIKAPWVSPAIKATAAAAVSTYFGVKASKHSQAAKWFNEMGENFKNKKGVCDPVDEQDCYCAIESNSQTQTCLASSMKSTWPKIALVCVDGSLQADVSCACKATNSCITQKFLALPSSTSLKGNIPLAQIIKSTDAFLNGELDGTSATYLRDNYNKATNRRLKEILPSLNLPKTNLNDEQKRQALALKEQGVPVELASALASSSTPSNASSIAQKLSAGGLSTASILSSSSKGTGTNVQANYNASSRPSKNKSSLSLIKGKQKIAQNAEILKFAEKAEERAQINRDTGKPLFDIISHRYRSSAWKKFEVIQ